MNRIGLVASLLCVIAGCDRPERAATTAPPKRPAVVETLSAARQNHSTHLVRTITSGEPVDPPPAGAFDLIRYPSAPGLLAAYVTSDPKDGRRRPAIVWITGGDCNTIGDVWTPKDRENDQSAAAYREAGVVMMFPSLRGGNENPGKKEGWLGEVDDVIAAADYLSKLPYVDPDRIYLGGHSTGGTLALLVSECTGRFRAVFSFGPVDDVRGYGDSLGDTPYDPTDTAETKLRSPGYWLTSIHSPTFVFEGDGRGNLSCLRRMAAVRGTPPAVHFYPVKGRTHFTILAPANEMIAKKIVVGGDIQFGDADIAQMAR